MCLVFTDVDADVGIPRAACHSCQINGVIDREDVDGLVGQLWGISGHLIAVAFVTKIL